MKFNDKELAAWAMVLTPDKEGMLEKKGAGRGQGYKLRWFRLKGNLLFYFKLQAEVERFDPSEEPIGMIILESCHVVPVQHDTRPHSFALTFDDDDSRTYILSACTCDEMKGWMEAIKMASYTYLKAIERDLRNKLSALTGKDNSPQPSTPKRNKDLRRSAYQKAPNEGRARRLVPSTSSRMENPQFELSLSCDTLPLADDGSPPSTLVRTRCFKEGHTSALSTLSLTDTVISSRSPVYTHLILMEVGQSCPETASLLFEVFYVKQEREESEENATTAPGEVSGDEDFTMLNKLMGKAECSVRAITSSGDKPLKLTLQDSSQVRGFLYVRSLKLNDVMTSSPMVSRRNALIPLDEGSPGGLLPSIMCASIRRHFLFSTTRGTHLKVIEEMAESVFNFQVPIELLRCYQIEDNKLLYELCNSVGALNDQWLDVLKSFQAMLFQSIAQYKHAITYLEEAADSCGFKPSSRRKDKDMMYVPTNLHIQRMRVQSEEPEKVYNTVTMGCPADHCQGFKTGGLKRLLWESPSNPSFISRWSEGNANEVQRVMMQLTEIQSSIHNHNNALYMACANALPQDMNSAMIGISSQVQQLLQKMQLPVVMDAIEALIRARPTVEEGEGGGGGGRKREEGEGKNSLLRAITRRKVSKQISLWRKSAQFSASVEERSSDEEGVSPPPSSPGPVRRLADFKQCSCGKCSRCVPSPSDWIWNGKKYVQVSTREWKMDDSLESIQHCLVKAVDAVEDATTKVVNQQHEAAAAAVGYAITTYKPTYVWSLELVPLFSELRQILDGLFKVTMSSLAFKLVELDTKVAKVEGLQVLRQRRDTVFAQALTAVITSFYLTLSENYKDETFLQQIRKIGFLVHFESLLSTYGNEIGMLEDMCVAVAELGNVHFQLGSLQGGSDPRFDFHITGTRSSLKVQLLFAKEYLAALPDEELRAGHMIKVVPILFTQGVNEMQNLASKHEQQLQEDINLQNMDLLALYLDKYEKLMESIGTVEEKQQFEKMRDLFKSVQRQLAMHKSKNVELLLFLKQLCLRVRGGRLTCCKSGKDRSSMAVTLEECSILRSHHHLLSNSFKTTLSTLRTHGTRLENCLKNTGHRCYHFNSLQLATLPGFLKPPRHTCREHA